MLVGMPRRRSLCTVFALIVACAGCDVLPEAGRRPDVDDDGAEGGALGAFDQALLDAHNATRATASPTPSPALSPLTWSTSLASTAQDWAERCVFEHSDGDLGENLAVFSPRDIDASTGTEVVELWASERADYTLSSNSCAAGAQCGHYTQLVWRDTERVGCGVATCDDIAGFGPGTLWVCNYDPAGNYIGEKPY